MQNEPNVDGLRLERVGPHARIMDALGRPIHDDWISKSDPRVGAIMSRDGLGAHSDIPTPSQNSGQKELF